MKTKLAVLGWNAVAKCGACLCVKPSLCSIPAQQEKVEEEDGGQLAV